MGSRMRLSRREFAKAVKEAVDGLPPQFRRYLENVVVEARDEPSATDFAKLGDENEDDEVDDKSGDEMLLGLFVGVPLTKQSYGERHPNRVYVFRRPLEMVCGSRAELLRQIRKTVLHELAHHFGFSEADLAAFEADESL